MLDRPYVLLSAAVSVDGALDDRTPRRLILSGDADLDAVDALRASCDAILVGAGTVRADNPRLLVRSPARRAAREARGLPPSPARVVLGRGPLDPAAAVFAGGPPPLVVGGDLAEVLDDLAGRGIRRLLVEGGASVLTAVLAAGLADELRLAVGPVFVGDPDAPRFLGAGRPPRLLGVETAGGTAVLRYAVG
jgi:5-amino-6-(5-phosphoribosylamino)uracil reductase